MVKTLISFGPLSIQSMSLFMVLAFLFSGFVFWRKAKEEHYDETEVFDGFLLAWIIGFIWARIGFIIFNFYEFGFHIFKWIDLVTNPGLNALFGIVGSTVYLYRFAQRKKWDVFEILDFWSMAVTLGLVLIWFGLFLDGSRFGLATSLPWGVVFPGVFEKHHPVQLYASFLYAGLFAYLAWLEFHYRTFEWYKSRRKSAQTGFLLSVFLIAHGLISLGLNLVMPAQIVFQGLRLDHLLSLVGILLGVGILLVRSGRIQDFKRS